MVPVKRQYTMPDAERFSDIANHFINERAYKNIAANLKKEKVDPKAAYMAYISKKLVNYIREQIRTAETTREQDGKILNSIGDFEKVTGHLYNLVEKQNEQFENDEIEKIMHSRSPFKVTREEAEEAVTYKKTSDDTEIELCVKNLFWINRAGKNMDIMQNAIIAKKAETILQKIKGYDKLTDDEKKEKRQEIQRNISGIVKKVYSGMAVDGKVDELTTSYQKAVSERGKMQGFSKSFEKAGVERKAKEVLKKISEDNKNNITKENYSKYMQILDDKDFLAQALAFTQSAGYMYLAKEYYINKIIEKRLEDRSKGIEDGVRIGTCATGQCDGKNSCMLVVTMAGYNSPVRVHAEKHRIESYKAGMELDEEDRVNASNNGQNPLNDAIVYRKHTKEEFTKLSQLRKKIYEKDISLNSLSTRQIYAILSMRDKKYHKHLYGSPSEEKNKTTVKQKGDWKKLDFSASTKEEAFSAISSAYNEKNKINSKDKGANDYER